MQQFGFPKKYKLKKKKHFQFVYQHGKAYACSQCVLYVWHGEGLQIGLAVGKKLGCAVLRNHVKRMMREAFRLHKNEFLPGHHLIWVARRKLVRADLKVYERALLHLTAEAGVLVEKEDG